MHYVLLCCLALPPKAVQFFEAHLHTLVSTSLSVSNCLTGWNASRCPHIRMYYVTTNINVSTSRHSGTLLLELRKS